MTAPEPRDTVDLPFRDGPADLAQRLAASLHAELDPAPVDVRELSRATLGRALRAQTRRSLATSAIAVLVLAVPVAVAVGLSAQQRGHRAPAVTDVVPTGSVPGRSLTADASAASLVLLPVPSTTPSWPR